MKLFLLYLHIFVIPTLYFMDQSQQALLDLDTFIWKNRIVLLFTDGDSNADYQAQIDELLPDRKGLDERDFKIFKISQGNVANDIWSEHALQVKGNVREKYNVPDDGFNVMLIGKDGAVKFRDSKPVSRKQLFAIIDAMPCAKQR
jgi:hypothetical protein